MPAGIVLAGGRSRRMGTPKAWLDWHGTTLLWRLCGLVARGVDGPVVVVRAPGQELPELPRGVRVVEDAREGRGPMQGLAAGLEAVDSDVAFAAAVDLPFLHPRFVAAVCEGAEHADAAVPVLDGFPQPLAAAYRPALAPLVAQLADGESRGFAALYDRCDTRRLHALPHPESVRNVNDPQDADEALAEGPPHVRAHALHGTPRELRAATLGMAAAAVGADLESHLATIDGRHTARDPRTPLAEGEEIAFLPAA